MIKKSILALALAAAVAAVAVPSFASFHSHGMDTKEGNFVCNNCDGTGRSYGPQGKGTGNSKCIFCNGTGFKGSY